MENNLVPSLFIFLFYSVSVYALGYFVMQMWFRDLPIILHGVGIFLIGTVIGTSLTYAMSVLSSLFVREPLLWGVLLTTLFCYLVSVFLSKKRKDVFSAKQETSRIFFGDVAMIIFSLAFGFWIMGKTMRTDSIGQVFVGGNTVFDFGQALGIIRSFSWGNNIPFTSPFFAGGQFFYHFFFLFWISIWEYFGIPLALAVNISSAVSFAVLLIVIYYLPQRIGKQGKLVGWLSVLLTITHSTLTFWYVLSQKGFSLQSLLDIWRIGTYPFAGPFDGSVISIFTTLNPYVNQRHLAFSIAFGLFILILGFEMIEKKKVLTGKTIFFGICTGLLFMFHMSVSLFVGLGMSLMYVINKRRKHMLIFIGVWMGVIGVLFVPYSTRINEVLGFLGLFYRSGLPSYTHSIASWSIPQYLLNNLGILPIIACMGFLVTGKKSKLFYGILTVFFILTIISAAIGKRGFDQKFYSFSIIGINILAAISLGWMARKGIVAKICTGILLCILTISGCIDLCVLKNEFAYPLISKEMVPVMTWIQNNTPKNTVFVSYSDIIDPVVLSGRKNYFGFFGNIGWKDRTLVVKGIYAGDINTAKKLGISYILAPKWDKNDFTYSVDDIYFREHGLVTYEDERFIVYRVNKE